MSRDARPKNTDAAPDRWHEDGGRGTEAPLGFVEGYRIEGLIHRGGQGSVYRAVQASTGRVVAIKVLRSGRHSSEIERRRFDREIDLVSLLDHPHVVAILDRGNMEGQPYFVMRFVEGRDLDVHVAESHPSLSERLRLLLAACDAVSHAHQRGILHRDIKPRNIRVDSRGEPHVLDFGLAKPLVDGALDAPSLTADGAFVGTFAWAAPEQLSGCPGATDVRTDVHALGLILYWLLTGRQPHADTADIAEATSRLLTGRPTRPREIVPGIPADLEIIALRAIAKEPERRYPSVDALAADVRRYLAGEAIEARRDSRIYVLRRAALRHAPLIAAAALTLTGLCIGLGMALVQRDRALDAEQQALASAEQARREARTSRAVSDFLMESLSESLQPGGGIFHAGSFAARAEEKARTKLAGEPVARDLVRQSLVYFYRAGGDPPSANRVLAEWVAEARASGDRERLLMALSQRAVASIEEGRADEGLVDADEALALVSAMDGGVADARLARFLAIAGGAHARASRFDVARTYFQSALAHLGDGDTPDERPRKWQLKSNLANVEADLGNTEGALQLHLELLADKIAADARVLDLAWSHRQIAQRLLDLGRLREAEAHAREAVGLLECEMMPRPDLALARGWLATILTKQGRCEEAIPIRRQALEWFVASAADSLALSTMLSSLAADLLACGRQDEAMVTIASAMRAAEAPGVGCEARCLAEDTLSQALEKAGDLAGAVGPAAWAAHLGETCSSVDAKRLGELRERARRLEAAAASTPVMMMTSRSPT